MARTHNICGIPPSIFASKFETYETAASRGPIPLGGPRFDGQGIAFTQGDRWKCFKVHVRRAWTPGAFWLALHHADGHWSSWPCIVSSNTLRKVIKQWSGIGEIRWAPESDESIEFGYPRIKHYGAKQFQPGNRIDYLQRNCISLLLREDRVSFTLRSYPHTISPGNTAHAGRWTEVDLMSTVPYSLKALHEFTEAALKTGVELHPEEWVLLNGKQRTDFFHAMGGYFTAFTDDLFEREPTWPNIEAKAQAAAASLKPTDVKKLEEDDPEVDTIRTRLKALKEAPTADGEEPEGDMEELFKPPAGDDYDRERGDE